MKTFLPWYFALASGGVFASAATAWADTQITVAVREVVEKQTVDDFFCFEAVFINQSDAEVHILVPDTVLGMASSVELKFSAPVTWHAKPSMGKNGSGTSEGGLGRFLVVKPRSEGSFRFDLRDYFEKVDLNVPNVELEIVGAGTSDRSLAGVQNRLSFYWKGILAVRVKELKNVTLLF